MSSNWKVIVVEDTFDDQQLVSRVLEHYGIQVYLAKTAMSACSCSHRSSRL